MMGVFFSSPRRAGKTQSQRFMETLPPGPVSAHLHNLHALALYYGATGDGLAVIEHHLHEIARYTQEDPRFAPRFTPPRKDQT